MSPYILKYFHEDLGYNDAKNGVVMFKDIDLDWCQEYYNDYLRGWDEAQLEMMEEK